MTDRIQKGDVDVRWCPTNLMTGDFFTKPLQGALFKRFRDLIMGVMPHPDVEDTRLHGKVKETDEEEDPEPGMTSEERGGSVQRHRSVLETGACCT